jgi:HAE1 family hydrophobic/amphiphilic exporter-1
MLGLIVLGLFSLRTLGLESFPEIEFPIVTISVVYPGASPDAVEQDVVKKIEEAINPVQQLREVSSTSMDSVGIIVAEFELERQSDRAMEDVRSAVAQIRRNLPDTIEEPVIQKIDPSQRPVMSIVLRPSNAASSVTERELTQVAEEFLKRRLEIVPGVGKVAVVGGVKREVAIQVDPSRMEALGITLPQIMGALGSDTMAIPSGNLLQDTREVSVRVDAKAKQVPDFEHVIVGNLQGRPIELREVTQVVDSQKERRDLARLDGMNAVALELQRQSGGNTAAMVKLVKAKLAELTPELNDKGIEYVIAKDDSKFINEAVEDVVIAILLGACITVLIVFYFLKSWRSTIITSLTLPVSIISAFIIMNVMNFTLNTITLMAMSLAVGILIDDAIVVRENITRHAEMGKDHVTAAVDGTSEIGPAVIATTLCILSVFIPVAFMSGIVGRIFFSFGMVVAFAVSVSLFVSFTLDPMLSAVWPDPEHAQGHGHHARARKRGPIMRTVDWFNDKLNDLEGFYSKAITWAVGHRKTVMTLGIGSFVLAILLMGFLGTDFQPEYDQGNLEVSLKTEPGANLEATIRKANEIENIIRTKSDGSPNPEVDLTYTTVGTGMFGTLNEGSIYIKLSDGKRRDYITIRRELRDRISNVPGVEIGVGAAGGMGGNNKPISIAILSPDRKLVETAEPLVRGIFEKITGAVDIGSSNDKGKPEVRLVVDRKRASDLGVSPMAVANVVRPMVDGIVVAKYEDVSGEQYDVRVRMTDQNRATIDQLGSLTVPSSKKDQFGNTINVKVSSVANFEEGLAPAKLQRRRMQSQVMLGSNKEAKSLNEVTGEVAKGVEELKAKGAFPSGVSVGFEGMARYSAETAGHMLTAILMAICFIYFVLASQFESFKLPVTIMLTMPLSMVGMVIMLLVTGDSMSMMSQIGLLMLMGLVTKNGILLIDRTLQLMREHNMPRKQALIEAGMTRLRPILMTSLAIIGGMMPMFLAFGAGAEMRAPMARAVIGGIMTSTVLTLIVIPVFFDILDEFSIKKLWNKIWDR